LLAQIIAQVAQGCGVMAFLVLIRATMATHHQINQSAADKDSSAAAGAAGLQYANDTEPGIERRK